MANRFTKSVFNPAKEFAKPTVPPKAEVPPTPAPLNPTPITTPTLQASPTEAIESLQAAFDTANAKAEKAEAEAADAKAKANSTQAAYNAELVTDEPQNLVSLTADLSAAKLTEKIATERANALRAKANTLKNDLMTAKNAQAIATIQHEMGLAVTALRNLEAEIEAETIKQYLAVPRVLVGTRQFVETLSGQQVAAFFARMNELGAKLESLVAQARSYGVEMSKPEVVWKYPSQIIGEKRADIRNPNNP